MTGSIRIIAGKYKGKKIPVLSHSSLRPTPNRIRETLFNWLMNDIQHASCLDAFAGSGALGLEALSRGAKEVVLIEKDFAAYQVLKQTIVDFKTNEALLYHQNIFDYLKHSSKIFDIIFLDPPFQSNDLDPFIQHLSSAALPAILTENGLLYIESQAPPCINPTQWFCLRSGRASSVYYGLYRRIYT